MNVKSCSKYWVMIKYYFYYIVFTLFLSGLTGCALFDKPVEIQTIANEKVKLELEPPKPVKPRDINFVVITADNYQEVFNEMEENAQDQVLFGLSDDDYEKLSLNLLELRNFIYQQRVIIEQYKNYYEGSEDEGNKTPK
jgi:hypothetical protein